MILLLEMTATLASTAVLNVHLTRIKILPLYYKLNVTRNSALSFSTHNIVFHNADSTAKWVVSHIYSEALITS